METAPKSANTYITTRNIPAMMAGRCRGSVIPRKRRHAATPWV